MRRQAPNTSRQIEWADKPAGTLPRIFGRGGRDRVMICLAMNGPMTVREIGRAIGSDSHKTFDMIEVLRKAGLVVKRDRKGGRRFVSLNKQLPFYGTLHKFLVALDTRWKAPRIWQPAYRWSMNFDSGKISSERLDEMFFSPVRSRVLLFVAAMGLTDQKTIYDTLGLGSVSAMYAVNHWEREGIFRSEQVGRHRLISLNPDFFAAKELKALLREIVARAPEYKGLRAAGRAKMKPILRSLEGRKPPAATKRSRR